MPMMPQHNHLRHHFSETRKQKEWMVTSVIKTSQWNSHHPLHWHTLTHTLLRKQQECERASVIKR